jgi:hypothetical protein
MASIINSTTTSPGGLISTGDSSNSLLIQTGDTTAITVNSSQVVSLTNPLPVASGGTGASSNAAAPFALKGANSDITSLSGLTTALSIAQGGTSATSATAAFNALNPMTTTGDMLYEASPTTAARLAIGSTGQILTVSGGIPTWATPASGGVTSLNGQTGAITNTDLYAIGSYINARPRNTTNYAPNSTLAGSSLYAGPSGGVWYSGDPNTFTYWNALTQGTFSLSSTLINTGTWRCISQAHVDGTSGITGLWVRIS